jgi:alpha-D-xyloside xylohydrolase
MQPKHIALNYSDFYKIIINLTCEYMNCLISKLLRAFRWILLVLVSSIFIGACNRSVFERLADGIILKTGKGFLKLNVCSESIIHVQFSLSDTFSSQKSLLVEDSKWTPIAFTIKQKQNELCLSTGKILAKINLKTGELKFFDANSKLLLEEKKGGGKTITPVEIDGIKTNNIRQEFETPADEALYGLGQHQDRLLNIKGYDLDLFQHNREVFIPVLISNKNYGILWHNYSHAKFGNPDSTVVINPACLYNDNGLNGQLSLRLYSDQDHKNSISVRGHEQAATEIRLTPDTIVKVALWTGEFQTTRAGEYTFMTICDGTIKVSVNGKSIIDTWSPFLRAREVGRMNLEANKRYKVAIEWIKENSTSRFAFKWLQPAVNNSTYSLWSEAGDQVDYYFMFGETIDNIIADYRQLTGNAPMMPKWGMGFWQCRERYKSQQEILDIVKEFRSRSVPLDVIVQDWQYWKFYEWGSHQFDPTRFPDPKAMTEELHKKMHAHMMISVWSKFYPGTDNFNELQKNGFLYPGLLRDSVKDFLGNKYTYYDAFNPAARKMYWDQINKNIFSKGIDSWWLDASEPETPDNNPSATDIMKYMNPTYLGPGFKYLNAYPLMTCKGVYEGQLEVAPDQRVCILTRSAFAGQQRYGTTVWSGDIVGRWEVLKASIPAGLGFCLSGFPYWTTDIGGFSVNYPGGNKNEEYRELFTRWYQFGSFCPVFRVHGTNTPREIWFFGETNQKAYQTQLKFNKLRYSLMPYLYSLAGMVNRMQYTPMRALVMDFMKDEQALNIQDQYMFGPAFLVNPVTDYKATRRMVYLPQCAGWYDFWTGEFLKAGQTIYAAAPYESMPIYVKAGSIIPFGPDIQYAEEKPADPITIRLYTGADATFNLYEDENVNNNYEHGKFINIPISWNEAGQTLTFGNQTGAFEGMLKQRKFNIIFISPKEKKAYAISKIDKSIDYYGREVEVKR